MMMKSNIHVQQAASPASTVRNSHVMRAIKHAMPVHIQAEEKPNHVKQLGTILSATALAASLMFGGRKLEEFNLFIFN